MALPAPWHNGISLGMGMPTVTLLKWTCCITEHRASKLPNQWAAFGLEYVDDSGWHMHLLSDRGCAYVDGRLGSSTSSPSSRQGTSCASPSTFFREGLTVRPDQSWTAASALGLQGPRSWSWTCERSRSRSLCASPHLGRRNGQGSQQNAAHRAQSVGSALRRDFLALTGGVRGEMAAAGGRRERRPVRILVLLDPTLCVLADLVVRTTVRHKTLRQEIGEEADAKGQTSETQTRDG